MLQRREALIDIVRQRVKPVLELVDRVVDLLDLARQRAHLVLELADADIVAERTLPVRRALRFTGVRRVGEVTAIGAPPGEAPR